MNKITLCAFLLIMFSLPQRVYASCDACAKAALDAASAAIQSSVGATTNVVTTNGQAIEAMNTSVQTGTQTLTSSLQLLNQKEITALDGVAKTITLKLEQLSAEEERSTDHLISAIQQIEKDLRIADVTMENSKIVGPRSQTLSGDINTARAQDLMTGFANRKELKKLFGKNMDTWLNNPSNLATSESEKAVLLAKDEFWDILPLLQKDVLTNEETNNIHVLLQLLIEPQPKKRATPNELAEGETAINTELNRLKQNAIARVSHDVLASILADKAPIIPTNESWMKSYFTLDKGEDDNISFTQFYEAETVGKLLSPDWFLDIKTRTEAGLLREQIYQTNTSNALLSEILKAERNETKLLSLSVLQRTSM